jgi:hypothetical protein
MLVRNRQLVLEEQLPRTQYSSSSAWVLMVQSLVG